MHARTTTSPAHLAGGRPSSLRLTAVFVAVAALLGVRTVHAQQTCYRDDTGRIVKRRQPGYTPVPCPAPGQPMRSTRPRRGSPGAPGTAASAPGTAAGEAQTVTHEQDRDFPGGYREPPYRVSGLPRPRLSDYAASIPLPDRWRIVDALKPPDTLTDAYNRQLLTYNPNNLLDPYNRNILKADRPVFGSWFFDLGLISDTQLQLEDIPTAVGGSATVSPGEYDTFGGEQRLSVVENIATEFTLYRGDTVFQPPNYQFKLTPVFNINYNQADEDETLNFDPRRGTDRTDHFVGLEEAFGEARLRVVSQRFDFDSVRLGIQPFNTDFRGFLFQDNQLGLRFFGTRDNNLWQYNLAWFRLLDKDTNSGLNDVEVPLRRDDVFVANLYRQDAPTAGFTSQLIVLYNRDREANEVRYDTDGFLVIPAPFGIERARDFDVYYLGYNGDGHFGRINVTTSLYYVFGTDTPGTFVDHQVDVSAGFGALELSQDFSWLRIRLSGLYATGDKNPYGGTETGFDSVFENPQFAGGDTSFWIAQAIPLIGGGGVALTGPNSILNDLRSSKDEGESNFANPGTGLVGVGADADLISELRLSFNLNDLYFAQTEVLEAARNAGGIDRHIGEEAEISAIYRPLDTQNIVVRTSFAHLVPGEGFRDLFPGKAANYLLINGILTY